MPNISLKLQGNLAARLSGGSAVLEVDSQTTLQKFLGNLDLDARHYVVILNNTVSPARNTILKDGDLVVVYPQMAGG